jgi:hypothetical protein
MTELIEDNINQEEEDIQELQRKIELLELSRLNLRLQPSTFDRLLSAAEFSGLTIEEYATNILVESLNTLVGKPTISGPSYLSGTPQGKVLGPVGNLVTRA